MELDFLTIDQVVEILSKELGITCDTKNIAELVREKQLETVFWFKGYIGEVNSPCIKDGIDSFPLAKLTNTDGFLKPSALHDQEIYDLLINEKTAIDISLVCKEQNLFVLFPDCDEDLIQDVLSYTRYDCENNQLINEIALVENFPLIVHDLTSKGVATSMPISLERLRITNSSLKNYLKKVKSKSSTTDSRRKIHLLEQEVQKLKTIIGGIMLVIKSSDRHKSLTQNKIYKEMHKKLNLKDAKISDRTFQTALADSNKEAEKIIIKKQ